MKQVLTSAIPPQGPASWYGVFRACKFCRGRLIRRQELTDGPIIFVKHERRCSALPKEK